MAKSVRYKLHKVSKKKAKREKNFVSGLKSGSKRRSFFLKFLKFLLILVAILLLGYWLFIAYTTVRDVKIVDVIGEDSELVTFSENGEVRRTLIVYEDPLATEQKILFLLAVIHNSDTSESLIYYIPSNLHIRDSFSDKHISVGNLAYAGESYLYSEKYAYVVRQMEEQLAIDFDSYIWFGSEVSKNFVSDSDNWGYRKDDALKIFNKLSFFNLIPKYYKVYLFEEFLHSNMNFLEMYSYFQTIKEIATTKNSHYIDLGTEPMYEKVVLGTGKQVQCLNVGEFDKSLRENIDILRTRELRREHVKVEVYNGTEIPGYAGIIARAIYNAGCKVLRHENTPIPYEKTHIYVSDIEKFSNGLEVVKNILDDYVIVEGRPDFLTTGDIVVVLGGE